MRRDRTLDLVGIPGVAAGKTAAASNQVLDKGKQVLDKGKEYTDKVIDNLPSKDSIKEFIVGGGLKNLAGGAALGAGAGILLGGGTHMLNTMDPVVRAKRRIRKIRKAQLEDEVPNPDPGLLGTPSQGMLTGAVAGGGLAALGAYLANKDKNSKFNLGQSGGEKTSAYNVPVNDMDMFAADVCQAFKQRIEEIYES